MTEVSGASVSSDKTQPASLPKLTEIEVRKLVGRFDHRIKFPSAWDYAILHGPNGVGKTKLLELVKAVMDGDFKSVRLVPFERLRLAFDDSTQIEIVNESLIQLEIADEEQRLALPSRILRTNFRDHEGDVYRWSTPTKALMTSDALQFLSRQTGYQRTPSGRWRSVRSPESFDDDLAFFERFTDMVPLPPADGAPPSHYAKFLEQAKVYLIETQRLVVRRNVGTARRIANSRVAEYADDLARRIRQALARNGTISSRLEKTFPNRLLSGGIADDLPSEEEIRSKYAAQMRIRNDLEKIAVLDVSSDPSLPERELEDWERAVLWMYLRDGSEKLAAFNQILARISVFGDIIGRRFQYKHIRFHQEKGFVFELDDHTELDPDRLSSGEQHELVLIYDLLFNVRPGTLVLIDEPEISLHVAWQQSFLTDIQRIAEINSLRFLIATHSPQIIHKSWQYTIALAPDSEDEESA